MKKVPELRFKDNNGKKFPDWDVKSVSDVAVLINGRAYSQPELLSSGKTPVLRVGNFFTNNSWYYSDLELDDSKYAHPGDLLYAWSATFGPKIWDGPTVIYHYHIWKVLVKSINKEFLYHWFDYDKKKIKSMQTGGTMNHITKGVMEKRKVPVPVYEEQEKIANFFSALDSRIEIQEEKIKNIEDQKKGYMQRIFSQELRFKDENGEDYPEWKETYLQDLFKITSSGDLDKNKLVDYEEFNKYPVYGNALTNNGLIGYYRDYKYESPAITVTGRGDIGNPMNRLERFNAIGRLLVLVPRETLDTGFFSEAIKLIRFYDESTGVPQLTAPTFGRYKVKYPSFNEQQKIANFLSVFDDKIEIEKKILETLQEMKRGFLQKMFV